MNNVNPTALGPLCKENTFEVITSLYNLSKLKRKKKHVKAELTNDF